MACTDYHIILETEKNNTAEISLWVFRLYLRIHLLLRFFYTKTFIWLFSLSPCIVFAFIFGPDSYLFLLFAHFVYWEFFGRDKYHELFDECHEDVIELDLTIQALRELKNERKNQNQPPLKEQK